MPKEHTKVNTRTKLFQSIEDTLKLYPKADLNDIADFLTIRDAILRTVEDYITSNK